MKIFQLVSSVQNDKFTVLPAKTVQIKKVMSLQDMIALKNKMANLKRAVKVGEKMYVENHGIEIPVGQK